MIRKALVFAAIVMALAFGASAAFAQYQPGQPGLVLVPSTTTPGAEVQATGFGCAKNVIVTLYIKDVVVGVGTTGKDAQGSYQLPIKAPNEPGQYVVVAKCAGTGGGEIVVSSLLTVNAAPAPAAVVPGLPPTGSGDTFPLTRMGLVLIAAGGLLVLSVRRRREA